MSSFTFAILIGTIVLFVGMAAYDTWFWGKHSVRPRERVTRLQTLFGWVFLGFWVGSFALWYHYAGTRPDIPRPETGNIYELNTHGSRAYLTLGDCVRLYTMMAIGFGGGLLTGVYAKKRRAIKPDF